MSTGCPLFGPAPTGWGDAIDWDDFSDVDERHPSDASLRKEEHDPFAEEPEDPHADGSFGEDSHDDLSWLGH